MDPHILLMLPLSVHKYVLFVVDIGETLQYLFAEREESKHDFVSEYVWCTYVSMLYYVYLYLHVIAAVLCVDITI